MNKRYFWLLACVAAAIIPFVIAGACGNFEEERTFETLQRASLSDLENIMDCYNLNGTDYSDYGCFCGNNTNSIPVDERGTPVDGSDSCCKQHDQDYTDAPSGCSCGAWGNPYWGNYSFHDCTSGRTEPDCNHSWNNACETYCCEADKRFARCLDGVRNSYNGCYYDWTDDDGPHCGHGAPNLYGEAFICESDQLADDSLGCSSGSKHEVTTISYMTVVTLGYTCRSTCHKAERCHHCSGYYQEGTSGQAPVTVDGKAECVPHSNPCAFQSPVEEDCSPY